MIKRFLLSLTFFTTFVPAVLLAQDDAMQDEIWDPLEPINRGIFWFNDTLDIYVAEPVSRAYHNNVPDFAQDGIHNFFLNLQYPRYVVSDLLQFKFCQLLEHTGRFVINTTVGIGGLIDVAEDVGLPDHHEDFGVALASMGTPPGPYLVLPVFGPSNFRDAIGKLVDGFLWPVNYVPSATNWSDGTTTAVTLGATALDLIDERAGLLEAIEAAKEASLDYYLFAQASYYQYRRGLLFDGNPPPEPGESTQGKDEFGDDF